MSTEKSDQKQRNYPLREKKKKKEWKKMWGMWGMLLSVDRIPHTKEKHQIQGFLEENVGDVGDVGDILMMREALLFFGADKSAHPKKLVHQFKKDACIDYDKGICLLHLFFGMAVLSALPYALYNGVWRTVPL